MSIFGRTVPLTWIQTLCEVSCQTHKIWLLAICLKECQSLGPYHPEYSPVILTFGRVSIYLCPTLCSFCYLISCQKSSKVAMIVTCVIPDMELLFFNAPSNISQKCQFLAYSSPKEWFYASLLTVKETLTEG